MRETVLSRAPVAGIYLVSIGGLSKTEKTSLILPSGITTVQNIGLYTGPEEHERIKKLDVQRPPA